MTIGHSTTEGGGEFPCQSELSAALADSYIHDADTSPPTPKSRTIARIKYPTFRRPVAVERITSSAKEVTPVVARVSPAAQAMATSIVLSAKAEETTLALAF